MKYEDLTRKIIGCAMTVHSSLGSGFQEVIYQRALAVEFKYTGIQFEREKEMTIHYRDEKIGKRRADFFIENCVMLEIKAVSELRPEHKAQAINYLEAYQMEIGLLFNFGAIRLEYNRLYNKNF